MESETLLLPLCLSFQKMRI